MQARINFYHSMMSRYDLETVLAMRYVAFLAVASFLPTEVESIGKPCAALMFRMEKNFQVLALLE